MKAPRFSLRVLLLLLTVALLLLGRWVRRSQQELAAERAVRQLQGRIRFVHQMHPERPPLGFFPWDNPAPGPAWLRRQLGDHYFTRINAVSLGDPTGGLMPVLDNQRLADLVERLRPLRRLVNLQLNCEHVTFDGLVPLSRLQRIQNLRLDVVRLGDNRMRFLQEMPALRMLSVHNTRANGSLVRLLTELSQLTALQLSGENLLDDDLAPLQELQQLDSLLLSGDRLTGAALSAVGRIQGLKHLVIDSKRLAEPAVGRLQGSPVEYVVLTGDLTDRVFEHVACLPKLQSLTIRAAGAVTGEGFAQLDGHPTLRRLTVSGIQHPTPDCFALLARIPHLELLELNCGAGAQNFEHLKQLQQLEMLEMALTPEQERELAKALPNCQIYNP